jgi:hypothetical protein
MPCPARLSPYFHRFFHEFWGIFSDPYLLSLGLNITRVGCLQYFATLADKKQYGVKIGIRENESGAQTSFYDLTPNIKF